MAFEIPTWVEAVSGDTPITLSARNYRTALDAIFASEGVVNATDLAVTPRAAGANMSVDVSAGLVVWQGDSIAGQGKYVARSSAAVNVNVSTAPGSGTRTDLIVAQLYDKQADGGTQYGWGVFALTGVTTAPASSVVLATLSIPAGTTSVTTANILQTGRQYAGLGRSSGLRPVQSIQVSDPGPVTANTPFSSAAWPPLTITIPPSGQFWVTITANLVNTTAFPSSTNAAIRCHWTTTGATITYGVSSSISDNSLSTISGRLWASRRTLVSGTPGGSVTITPGRAYSTADADGGISNGVLAVEFVA
jgi:hypothetical protein